LKKGNEGFKDDMGNWGDEGLKLGLRADFGKIIT